MSARFHIAADSKLTVICYDATGWSPAEGEILSECKQRLVADPQNTHQLS